jgi:hypothetical protein
VDYVAHPQGGEEGALVEVFNALGESLAVVALPVSAIEPVRADEVLAVRPLAKVGQSPYTRADGRSTAAVRATVASDSEVLRQALLDAIRGRQDKLWPTAQDEHGQRYILDFELSTAAGTATVRSSWIWASSRTNPRRGREASMREDLHKLIDQLPEADLATAARVLGALTATASADAALRALDSAPVDDEPETPEEASAVAAAWDEHRRGESY